MIRMICFTIVIGLFYAVPLISMDDNKIVEKPYKPTIIAQYPNATRSLISSAGGLFGSYIVNLIGQKTGIKAGFLDYCLGGIGGFSLTNFLLTNFLLKYRAPNLLNSLLCNPKDALDYGYKINDAFYKELNQNGIEDMSKTADEQIQIYTTLVEKYEKKSPVFLLGECTQEGFGACLLSRSYQPKFREMYEQKVVNSLEQAAKESGKKGLEYVSFACGGKFQDLVIATKYLAQNPGANMTIHLIDFEHAPYVGTSDLLKNKRKVDPKIKIDMEPIKMELIKHAKEHWGAKELSDEETIKNMKIALITRDATYKQFISWLNRKFPKANLSLVIHESADSYLKFVDENKCSYSDVITTADIQDEMSLMKNSTQDYGKLCVTTLQKNPKNKNIWLGKKDYYTAIINSISLIRMKNAEEIEIEFDDKNSVKAYIQTEKLN